MKTSLKGAKVVVTGGSKGYGAGIGNPTEDKRRTGLVRGRDRPKGRIGLFP